MYNKEQIQSFKEMRIILASQINYYKYISNDENYKKEYQKLELQIKKLKQEQDCFTNQHQEASIKIKELQSQSDDVNNKLIAAKVDPMKERERKVSKLRQRIKSLREHLQKLEAEL